MESFLVNATAALRAMGVEWPLLAVAATALVLLCLVRAVWLLHGVRRELSYLALDTEARWAENARQASELLRIAAAHLESIDRKLDQVLPPNFRVRSIRADNLVVRPDGNDRRPVRRVAPSVEGW